MPVTPPITPTPPAANPPFERQKTDSPRPLPQTRLIYRPPSLTNPLPLSRRNSVTLENTPSSAGTPGSDLSSNECFTPLSSPESESDQAKPLPPSHRRRSFSLSIDIPSDTVLPASPPTKNAIFPAISVRERGSQSALTAEEGAFIEGIKKAVALDRYAFFTEFFKNFYNADVFLGKRVSEQAIQASWNVAASASPTASFACVDTWHEDFRQDVAKIDVPTLVIHGDADRIVPHSSAGKRTASMIKGARLVTIKDGPHCVLWTHAEEVNAELVKFLGSAKRVGSTPQQEAVA